MSPEWIHWGEFLNLADYTSKKYDKCGVDTVLIVDHSDGGVAMVDSYDSIYLESAQMQIAKIHFFLRNVAQLDILRTV